LMFSAPLLGHNVASAQNTLPSRKIPSFFNTKLKCPHLSSFPEHQPSVVSLFHYFPMSLSTYIYNIT
jgi:hypothetical protein